MRWRRAVGWQPASLAWRVAALFLAGSSLFALGSFPAYAGRVDGRALGITFVVGAVLFTAAAASQLVQVSGGIRVWAPQARDAVWAACWVQLAGTLLFNVNTIDAMVTTFDVQQVNRLVWAPDFLGSIAFLIASHLAWLAVRGRPWPVRREDPEWWAAVLNYVGSVFFMASAIGAFTLETTGEPVNLALVNGGTFLGAVCFWLGAWAVLPTPRRQPVP
ncbi:hypothetical protein E8D34_13915 [Nocardioides sp. GY 10113]|uniref:YrhK family protein n=1 Tax=Nocardioides sp. GY 10113 TaxID=2569761 RepID=UPI0010A8B508|nr:YrhK family protein [Nocardioides sp. GY 10113]TIC84811.1 hypothetical protein E8D34_13915 [Nocardioides sp. GY 10113]